MTALYQYLRITQRPGPVTVTSPSGIWLADPITGNVESRFGERDGVGCVTRFDFLEWQDYWGWPVTGMTVDMSDVGYWRGNLYRPADANWREEVREARRRAALSFLERLEGGKRERAS